jgi:hypothetical protein
MINKNHMMDVTAFSAQSLAENGLHMLSSNEMKPLLTVANLIWLLPACGWLMAGAKF